MKFVKEHLVLYGITDCSDGYSERVETALQSGITMLQLREKNLSEKELIEAGKRLKELCGRYNVPFIVNDSPEIALKCGADGVHVGLEDTPVSEVRKIAGAEFIIGATAKTVQQARTAEAQGADYLGVGAVFPSPTKTNAVRITNEQLREITSAVKIPCVAIGGITVENVTELKGSGAAGIAVVSAIFGAEDIAGACGKLKQLIVDSVQCTVNVHLATLDDLQIFPAYGRKNARP